jgi:hypothetical protein
MAKGVSNGTITKLANTVSKAGIAYIAVAIGETVLYYSCHSPQRKDLSDSTLRNFANAPLAQMYY